MPVVTGLQPATLCQGSASSTVIIQNFISTQKHPGCKKGVVLFKIASVKKVVKSKGVAKK